MHMSTTAKPTAEQMIEHNRNFAYSKRGYAENGCDVPNYHVPNR